MASPAVVAAMAAQALIPVFLSIYICWMHSLPPLFVFFIMALGTKYPGKWRVFYGVQYGTVKIMAYIATEFSLGTGLSSMHASPELCVPFRTLQMAVSAEYVVPCVLSHRMDAIG
jgi:hypothetical protein